MQKTSKVTNVSYRGTFESQHGTFHKHWIEFENGDAGQYASKLETQDKFTIGQEANYDYSKNGDYVKIKPVQQENQYRGGGKRGETEEEKKARLLAEKKRQYMIMLQSSTDYAIKAESELMDIAMKYLIAKGQQPTPDDIQAVRDILYPAFIANIQSSQKDILNHILSETKKHFPNE